MKFKYCENIFLALLLIFLRLIKRCCPSTSIEMVDPLVIKINIEKLEIIPIIIVLNKNIENREGKKIKLIQKNGNFENELYSLEENKQDKNNKKKIEFSFNQEDFKNHYGKYELYYYEDDGSSINYNRTIFIYQNDLILKNPKKKYFLTGGGTVNVRYDFSESIASDEINKIQYYSETDPTNIKQLDNFALDDDKKLLIQFPRASKYSSYIFDIFPEYDENATIADIQRFYLYFQDYLLDNDAIYINKKDYTNEVSFNLTLTGTFDNNLLSIGGYYYKYNQLNKNKNIYEITINLGYKNYPGKISISYNGQERELYYILYESNFERCYDKETIKSLEISMEWIEELEYDHFLYFNDTTTKLLTQKYEGKSGTIVKYSYKYSTLQLSSGIFSLKSSIPALNYTLSYNPVDNKHLYFYIYPNSETFNKNHSIIFSHNNSNQYIYISSSDSEGTTVLDEIILRRDDNKVEILVSKTKGNCHPDHNLFYCDLKDIIFNYNKEQNGDYSIIYKSKCEKNLTIEGNIVTIKRGISLSDIDKKWINKSCVNKTDLFLTYDDDLTDRALEICFILKTETKCKYNASINSINENKVKISLNDMDEGIYYVKTNISNEGINFVQEDKNFKVSDPKINFKFNHHYFVKNDNPNNKLIITVADPYNQFGCKIVENIESKILNNGSNNCSIFEYSINKIGTIKFNYYDKDNFVIPVDDSIVVVSNYPQFFSFNEKFCYYYLFETYIEILNSYKNNLKIKVFLKNDNDHIFILNNSKNYENRYTYKNINASFLSSQGFVLYISEEEVDDKIYLYKSDNKVKFTSIKVPEYIMEPNKTIIFSDVNCDLNSSSFIIKKIDLNFQKTLIYWKYDSINRDLYFNISGDFYQTNRLRYYYYQIDSYNITNIDNRDELNKTFVSKRLNETNFEIKKADSNDYITITNKEKDFYFPLILRLNTLQEYRIPKNLTSERKDLTINDDESTIRFDYNLAINDVLRINYLEREVPVWEERGKLGNSIYYFFNKDNIINGSSLVISPKIFAFNILKQEDYIITILYSDEKQKNYKKINLINCTNHTNNILEQECHIDFSTFINNNAQSIRVGITDNNSNFYENIHFIYYHLDEKSKQCQTLNSNMNNITLLVDIPNSNLKDKIKLTSADTDIIGENRGNSRITFTLNGNNINLQNTYLELFTDDEELNHLFTLQELGINILPKYKIRFNNNKNVTYLLPEGNQIVKVFISVGNNDVINLDDISGFIIKGENNKDLQYKVENKSIIGEAYALNLIFNLSIVSNSEKNYLLYYIDRCKEEFQTDLKIALVSFTFKRKYFVLNNNNNLKYQILKIEGPVNEKISIQVFKNGEYQGEAMNNASNNYYLNISQTSRGPQGNYTFKVINDGIESSINEIIYVRENLEEILSLKNNISDCMFSNPNKSAIKNFSYTITPSKINTNFNDFQSYFSPNKITFTNLTSYTSGKDKSFYINFSNEMKNSIVLNSKLYIYLTENNDIEQPIYIFNYSYTNIELLPNFTKFIYTDADYISFRMNCKINDMKNFELFNSIGNTYSFNCENRDNNDMFIENEHLFKCYLSSDDSSKNNLLNFGKTIFEYQNFNLKYQQIQITNEPFFLSQDIYTADFTIKTPEQIDRNVSINIGVTTPKKIFYFSEVEKITYANNSYQKEENIDFKYYSNNSIYFSLYIQSKVTYSIKKICRRSCSYCKRNRDYIKEVDCQIKNETIKSNTPEIYFTFDKHYIALNNSSYPNNNGKIDTLTIKSTGESEIPELIYYINKIKEGNIKSKNGTFQLNQIKQGKYTFEYEYYNKKYSIKDIVLVTNYDYEMFDFSDFSSKCLFYNLTTQRLFVSLNPNPNYEFKNDIILADLILESNGIEFSYEGEKGYKTNYNYDFSNSNHNISIREKNQPNNNNNIFVFTKIDNINITTINSYSIIEFYYKDNIFFKNQNCFSNNIYIKSLSNENERFSLLQCDYKDYSNKITYYTTNYGFSYKTNDFFYLYIGINKINTSIPIRIYNSIYDSTFILQYINPTIYIKSSNFDLGKIYQFTINDTHNIFGNEFNYNESSSSIIYKLVNGTGNYITELWRKNHTYDRNTTIRNKKVNLKIEKSLCPKYMVEVSTKDGYICSYCKDLRNSVNMWFQKDQCVSACNEKENYFIYDKVNYICENCPEKTYDSGQLVCGCLEGTIKSDLDGICYLPESLEIKKTLLIRQNAQCYRVDGAQHNYCKNETTSKCELVEYSGAFFPICHCNDNYEGKYCEKNKNDKNYLEDKIDSILNNTINDKLDESDVSVISKIRGIIFFLENDDYTINNEGKTLTLIKSLVNASINCIKEAVKEKHNYFQIYDVIEITIYFLNYLKNNNLRLLEEEKNQIENNLYFILENAHYLNYLANKDYTGNNYFVQTDKLNLVSFISYRADAIDNSFKTYIKNMTNNSDIIGYINLNDKTDSNEVVKIILTIYNRKLLYPDSSDPGLIFNVSISDNKTISENNFHAYFYSSNMKVNFDLANYYKMKNIHIYNRDDSCFKDACFISENFTFDLTQKYRKKYVFQKWNLKSSNCKYSSYETLSNNIEILCTKFDNYTGKNDSINYATLDLSSYEGDLDNKDKVFNLPLKCQKKVKSKNYGFWIFFIICIFEIFYIIGITILTLGSLKRVSVRKGLINDGLFYIIPRIRNSNDDMESNKDSPLNNKIGEYNKSLNEMFDDKPIGSYNKTLFEAILSNFKELYPLSCFFRVSIISPLIMNSWFFVFNSLCLFGFNSLIYYEGLIEKRIYDKKRDYFDYPMRKEFHKIILSILLQIALTVIIKVIILVSLKQHINLERKLRSCKTKGDQINNDILVITNQFQEEMLIRRLIGGFLMALIIIFFFYYSVEFCEVYLNTQRNLVFSWIWSLFWEWIIFAPIYIVVISFLENKKSNSKDPVIYYLKRLFFF